METPVGNKTVKSFCQKCGRETTWAIGHYLFGGKMKYSYTCLGCGTIREVTKTNSEI